MFSHPGLRLAFLITRKRRRIGCKSQKEIKGEAFVPGGDSVGTELRARFLFVAREQDLGLAPGAEVELGEAFGECERGVAAVFQDDGCAGGEPVA